jgi:hypothetical protein
VGRAIAVTLQTSNGDGRRQTGGPSFQPDHTNQTADPGSTAVQPSSPDGDESDPEPDPEFGKCPFCNGYTVEHEHVDEATGEVTPQSFTRPCRRTRCPVCGAINEPYKSSYGQHVASLIERLDAHPSEVRFLSVSLLREWADEAGIEEWEDSYQVLTGDGGPWSKALRRLRSRDPQLVFAGTISARPSDGRAHVHLVLVTRLSVEQIKEAALRFPLDGHAKTPAPTDSAERFAANCAEYAFENHAHAPSARFTASRSHGAGYHSEAAKARRREAVSSGEDGGQGARDGVEQTSDVGGEPDTPDPAVESSSWAAGNGQKDETEGQTTERGPPVDLGGQTYRTETGKLHAVKHHLSRRVGTAVHVSGMGPAELLQVKGEGEDLRCVVAPEIASKAVTVAWSEIYTRNVPTVEASDSTSTDPNRSMDSTTTDDQPGPLERLQRARERADGDRVVSRFTHERHDGTEKVTEKYADGTTDTFTRDAHE